MIKNVCVTDGIREFKKLRGMLEPCKSLWIHKPYEEMNHVTC